MAESYHLGLGRRLLNVAVRGALALGVAGGDTQLLTVRGRKTGKPHSTPVIVIKHAGGEWLVAPYGPRDWVKNLRVARTASLRRRRRERAIQAEEVAPAEAAPVIRRYVEQVPVTRKFWDVTPESPDEAFLQEAASHPVFRVRDR